MTQYIIDGGRALRGEIKASGSKNALLPIMAATLFVRGKCVLRNCPHLSDVDNTMEILQYIGCNVSRSGDVITIDSTRVERYDIPERLMKKCRASVCFIAPLIGRFGRCIITYPGGCSIGARPINYHIAALRALGRIDVIESGNSIELRGVITGGEYTLPYKSVGATECALLCAAFANGQIQNQGSTYCRINNPALEPEIVDLQNFLCQCGCMMEGAGGECIKAMRGGRRVNHVEYTVMSDRIEGATYALAAAATRGEIYIKGCNEQYMTAITQFLQAIGADVSAHGDVYYVKATNRVLKGVPLLIAKPYPSFPTDLQAPACAVLATCVGRSVVYDSVFNERYAHIGKMLQFGVSCSCEQSAGGENIAVIDGLQEMLIVARHGGQGRRLRSTLHGCQTENTDLRAGAALIITALASHGRSVVCDNGYIERGYEDISGKISALGGSIICVS